MVLTITCIADWGKKFPGFEKELEGAQYDDGEYRIWVLKDEIIR
ncbi:hypothetical protein [Sodalis sp. RH16]